MTAAKLDLDIEQGADWAIGLTLQDATPAAIDITGWTFRGSIRKRYSSAQKLADLTFAITGAITGQVTASLTATQTSALPADEATTDEIALTTLIYDIEAVRADSSIIRIMQGAINLSPEVTR